MVQEQVHVGLEMECNISACCIHKLRWDFLVAMLRRTIKAMLAIPGFPWVTDARPMLQPTAVS